MSKSCHSLWMIGATCLVALRIATAQPAPEPTGHAPSKRPADAERAGVVLAFPTESSLRAVAATPSCELAAGDLACFRLTIMNVSATDVTTLTLSSITLWVDPPGPEAPSLPDRFLTSGVVIDREWNIPPGMSLTVFHRGFQPSAPGKWRFAWLCFGEETPFMNTGDRYTARDGKVYTFISPVFEIEVTGSPLDISALVPYAIYVGSPADWRDVREPHRSRAIDFIRALPSGSHLGKLLAVAELSTKIRGTVAEQDAAIRELWTAFGKLPRFHRQMTFESVKRLIQGHLEEWQDREASARWRDELNRTAFDLLSNDANIGVDVISVSRE